MASGDSSDFIQQGNVYTSNFNPLLYTVAAGSYAANWVHSPGAAEVTNYLTQQIIATTSIVLGGTTTAFGTANARVMRDGNQVSFQISLSVNDVALASATLATELRIRCQSVAGTGIPYTGTTVGSLARYYKNLPASSYGNQPLFSLQLVDLITGKQLITNSSVHANLNLYGRLLTDGTLALLKESTSATGGGSPVLGSTAMSALTVTDVANIMTSNGFNPSVPNGTQFLVFGNYLVKS